MPEWTNSRDEGALPPSPPPKPLASWYAQGLSDGLGDRLLMFDNSDAPSLELLRFRPDLAQVPGFEAALRDQVRRLDRFRHPAFARVRSVQRLEPDDDLALISNCTPGKRLSEVLHHTRGPAFAAALIRQLAPALVQFQQHAAGISHGVLTPDRIVVSPEGRLTIVEHVVGPAIDSLDLQPAQLSSIGVALPPAAHGARPRLDAAADWYQLGLVALSVLIGRPVTTSELPHVARLLNGSGQPPGSDGAALPPFIRQWLDRALQLSGTRIESASDARAALEELLQKEQTRDTLRVEAPREEQPAPVAASGVESVADERPEVAPSTPAIVTPPSSAAQAAEPESRATAAPPALPMAVRSAPEHDATMPADLAPFDVHETLADVLDLFGSEPAAEQTPALGSSRGTAPQDAKAAVRSREQDSAPTTAASVRDTQPAAPRPVQGSQPATAPRFHDPRPAARSTVQSAHVATAPRFYDPRAAARPPLTAAQPASRVVDRTGVSTSVVAALLLIIVLEAGAIAWLATALSSSAHPVIAVETAAAGGKTAVSTRSTEAAPLRLSAAPDLQWVRVTSASSPGLLGGSPSTTGTIRISSPISLKVFEKSRQVGSVPGADLKVAPGRHDIDLVNPALGYSLKQAVDVEAGQSVSILVAPPPGSVTIFAVPTAEVSLDGKAIGRTPLGPLPIALGEHYVTFRHATGLTDRKRVMVRSGESVRVIGNVHR